MLLSQVSSCKPESHEAVALSETPVASEARIQNWSRLIRCGPRRKSAVFRIVVALRALRLCGLDFFAVVSLRAFGRRLLVTRAQPHER